MMVRHLTVEVCRRARVEAIADGTTINILSSWKVFFYYYVFLSF